MRDYTQEINESLETLRQIGEAAFIALALCCGIAMIWIVAAVVCS